MNVEFLRFGVERETGRTGVDRLRTKMNGPGQDPFPEYKNFQEYPHRGTPRSTTFLQVPADCLVMGAVANKRAASRAWLPSREVDGGAGAPASSYSVLLRKSPEEENRLEGAAGRDRGPPLSVIVRAGLGACEEGSWRPTFRRRAGWRPLCRVSCTRSPLATTAKAFNESRSMAPEAGKGFLQATGAHLGRFFSAGGGLANAAETPCAGRKRIGRVEHRHLLVADPRRETQTTATLGRIKARSEVEQAVHGPKSSAPTARGCGFQRHSGRALKDQAGVRPAFPGLHSRGELIYAEKKADFRKKRASANLGTRRNWPTPPLFPLSARKEGQGGLERKGRGVGSDAGFGVQNFLSDKGHSSGAAMRARGDNRLRRRQNPPKVPNAKIPK